MPQPGGGGGGGGRKEEEVAYVVCIQSNTRCKFYSRFEIFE